MRERKFRAYSTSLHVWADGVTLFHDGSFSCTVGSVEGYDAKDGFEVGEYTGLKDKNGTEIFEGDIVEYLDSVLAIVWSDVLARPILQPYTIEHHYDLNVDVAEECTIIGNIYEHPNKKEVS